MSHKKKNKFSTNAWTPLGETSVVIYLYNSKGMFLVETKNNQQWYKWKYN